MKICNCTNRKLTAPRYSRKIFAIHQGNPSPFTQTLQKTNKLLE